MCTDAYREALIRDLSSTASPAPASTPAPGQRHATEAGAKASRGARSGNVRSRQDDLESRGVAAAGAAAGSGPAMALAQDATVVNGEVIDRR